MNQQSIQCEVDNCIYYEKNKCMAKSIMVTKECNCPSASCDTNCKTFRLK